MFSVKPLVEKNKVKKKKAKGKEGGLGFKKLQEEHQKLADVQHTPLLYDNIVEGQVILGCIQEVHDYELKVSLPHRLSGTVPITKISKAYTELVKKMAEGENEDEEVSALQELYRPGQFVVTSVASIEEMENWKKVSLSLMPQDVNSSLNASLLEVGFVLPCAVASVEDNGFIMDTGIANMRGAFLPHKAAQGADIVGVGTVLRCMVTKISGDAEKGWWNVVLSAKPKAVSEATLPLISTTNLSMMIPGTAVDTVVSKVEDYGLNIILAEYDGVVNRIHLKKPFDIIHHYQEGMNVKARVLYTTPMNKVVHFTLQKNIFSEGPDEKLFHDLKEGDIVEDAVVYESRSVGISLKLNDKYRGYCSWNRLMDGDKPPKNMKKVFPIGRQLVCRILKYSSMDQMYIVSLEKSVIEQQLLSYNEVEVGTKLKATIKGYNDFGAQVALSKTVSGHIDFMMLTDTQIKNPEKKYPAGSVLDCRVVYVVPQRKIINLTSKKLLVNSPHPIISEYDPNLVGAISEGCVVRINQSGLLVTMYNDVKGFVPKSQATSRKVTSLDALFTLGQVVKFRIINVEPEKRNMTLSLRIDGGLVPHEEKPAAVAVSMRQKVDGVIKEIQEKVIIVTLKNEGVDAQLPVSHLLDDVSKCGIVKSLLKEGDEVKDAVVFSIEEEIITLSLKTSVHNWINTSTPEQQEVLLKSVPYPAVLQKVYAHGALAKIPAGECGQKHLIHFKKLGDESPYIDCRAVGLHPGQTLWVESEGVDKMGRQILSCLHTRNVQRRAVQHSIQPLYSRLLNLKMVKDIIMKRGSAIDRQLAELQIGRKLGVTVTEVTDFGLHVNMKGSQIQGFISKDHRGPYTNVVVGQKLYACVMNVNFEKQSVDLSSQPLVVKKLKTSDTPKVSFGRRAKCEIIQVQENFVKVMLTSRDVGLEAYLPPLEHELNIETKNAHYKVGEEHRVTIEHVDGGIVVAVLRRFEDKDTEPKLLSDGPSWQLSSNNTSESMEAVEDIESDAEEVAETYAKLLVECKKAKRKEEIENQWKTQAAKKRKREESGATGEEEAPKKKKKKKKAKRKKPKKGQKTVQM